MSIATKTGDTGQTGLAGGIRLSKADLRVEAYGTVDELGTVLGFARSLCPDPELNAWTAEIQRMLFHVGAALSTPTAGLATTKTITQYDVDFLENLIAQLESQPEPTSPQPHPQVAAYEIARTVCLRAGRIAAEFIADELAPTPSPLGLQVPEPAEADKPLPLRLTLTFLQQLASLIGLFARRLQLGLSSDL
jgi:cob(I)alamin adenosyltransferase